MFTALSIIALVSAPLGELVAIRAMFSGSLGCFQRIQAFLSSEEKCDQLCGSNGHQPGFTVDEKCGNGSRVSGLANGAVIKLQKACFQTRDKADVIREIDLEISASTLNLVTGDVGSGKSSLLMAILGELMLVGGTKDVRCYQGSIAFCSQVPWLRNVSILENIVAGTDFDERWYSQVLNACALDVDFGSDVSRDQRLAGTEGISLSGGQKQRIVSTYPLDQTEKKPWQIILENQDFDSRDKPTCRLWRARSTPDPRSSSSMMFSVD